MLLPTLAARKLAGILCNVPPHLTDVFTVSLAAGYRILSTFTLADEVSFSSPPTFAFGPLLVLPAPRHGRNYWSAVCSWALEWVPRPAVFLSSPRRTRLLLSEVLSS